MDQQEINGPISATAADDTAVFFVPTAGRMPPAFGADTRIAAPGGTQTIAAFAAGDRITNAGQSAATIGWIAQRHLRADLLHPSDAATSLPICIAAAALAPGMPQRDLYLSPACLLHLQGALYPAGSLVNDITITQPQRNDTVAYWQLLADGALLTAEGVPVASLDDLGWINAFGNASTAPATPTLPPPHPRATATMIAAMRALLTKRATMLAQSPTDDPAPLLWLEGRLLHPTQPAAGIYHFAVTDAPANIRLLSRTVIPAEMPGGGPDKRRLGLCLIGMTLRSPQMTLDIQPASGQLVDGFYPIENEGDPAWTDGFALLPPQFRALIGPDFTLEIRLVATPLRFSQAPVQVQPRALVLDASLPTPDHDAGSNVMVAHIALLQALGFAVTFVPTDNFARTEPYASQLEATAVHLVHRPYFNDLSHFLAAHAEDFALAYVHRLTVADTAIPLLRRAMPGLPILYNTADLHSLRRARSAALSGDPVEAALARTEQASEFAAIAAANVTLLCNTVEIDLVRAALPECQLVYLPWVCAAIAEVPQPFPGRDGMMFLGGFRHPPNVDAMLWFVAEIMPRLRALSAGITLTIYGADMPAEIAALAADDVLIGGFLPTLAPAFARHRISIAPLRYGAGFKGKLAESLAHGVPAVCSPIAAEGTGLAHDIEILLADTPDAIAAAIIRLYHDEPLWNRLAAAGRRYVETKLSPAQGLLAMRQAVRAAGVAMLLADAATV